VTAPDGVWLARPERPADGTPVAVKDLLDTAGLVTTYGSILFAEHVPARSADAVLRLEAAGYGVAGKTNLHEFA
jgi:Asp-tRNA(Asn)/Glu-tRNA(Gln) amidotransferase A subunit family amidase